MDLSVLWLRGPRPVDGTGAWALKVTAPPALAALAQRIFYSPWMAGESQHLLSGLHLHPLMALWRTVEIRPGAGRGESSTLRAALSAERRWERTRSSFLMRSTLTSLHAVASDWTTGPATFERRPRLSSVPPFDGPAAGWAVRVTAGVVEWCRSLWSAEAADWAALVADLAYWRRTADELWELLSTRVGLPPEPAEAVILESSPCGIRRLTAVRVPRAPGSWRAPSIPNLSVLAAA